MVVRTRQSHAKERNQTIIFGEGNGTPLQYSCLGNPIDRGAWQATAHGVAKSQTRLSNLTFTFHFHALEKEIAIHSSVLAQRIPGMGAWWAVVYSHTELDRTEAIQQQFLPRSKNLLISWVQSLPAVILEPQNIKSVTISIVSPSICDELMGSDARILVL